MGPDAEPEPRGLGGGGGVVPPPTPEDGAGDRVSLRPGSSSNRALGGFSTVELRTVPLPAPDGAVDDAAGVSEIGVSTSDGTELTVPPVGSSITVALEPPQLVQGLVTGTGVAKIGRYELRLWLQPPTVKAANERTAICQVHRGRTANKASFCGAIMTLLARLNSRPTSQIGSQRSMDCKWDAEGTIDVFTTIAP